MKSALNKILAFFGAKTVGVKYKTIEYVRHARRRMKWRQISEEEVVRTLSSPDKTVVLEDNRYHVYKVIGSRNVRVTYRLSAGKVMVLTVVDKSD
ncbi:MAG: DUF4258 domain-containing protein [Candidatus Omnitrophota bacterium]|nr:DUF4258 domain-containing protein [Candidatus Omnitrophota bacterium]